MAQVLTVRRTYKYRLYRHDKHDRWLHRQINVAGWIWNHALALQRRYYRWYGKHLSLKRLKAHIARLRMRHPRFAGWKVLGSQAVQDVLERLEAAWERFFHKQSGPPRFKKVKRYKSFTLKQAGWKLLAYNRNERRPDGKYQRARGVVEVGGRRYKFIQHRPMAGVVKTVTIKRDVVGGLWVCFSVQEVIVLPELADLSRIGGFDFGLQTFLTDDSGQRWMHPLFFAALLARLRALHRCLSHKVEGSHHREGARWLLARTHTRIADKRRDFHFKLANALCDLFDVLVFEDLSLAGMKRLWGRKVSDLGFGKFMAILRFVALKRSKVVVLIPRFERTTGKCSGCGHEQTLTLKQRRFDCPVCGLSLDRDHNAAINIQRAGTSARGLRDHQSRPVEPSRLKPPASDFQSGEYVTITKILAHFCDSWL